MAESMYFRPPGELNITSGNISENFRKWKQQMSVYMTASGADEKDNAIKKAIILNIAGEDLLEVSNHFQYADGEDNNDPKVLLKKIEAYCSPKKSEVYESYKFWTAPLLQSIDQFVADLRTRAKNCNFGDMTNRLIRDKIIFTLVDSNLKTRLMREQEDLTLDKLIDICRAHDLAQGQIKDMSSTLQSATINQVGAAPRYGKRNTRNPVPHSDNGGVRTCLYCNQKHVMSKFQCPAYGKICTSCKSKNHFPSAIRCPRNANVKVVSSTQGKHPMGMDH